MLALWRKSRRASVTRACALATLTRALARFAEPGWHRARRRWYRLRRFWCRSQSFGCGIFSPVDRAAKPVRPASTPALSPVAGSGTGSGTSARKVTNHRPAGSRATVTDAGSALVTSTSGHVHTKASGAGVFASHKVPSLIRNAARVYVADWRPARDLNRGYRARFSKNAVNAWCWCRRACWRGTLDTWLRNARSGSFFMAVSARSVSA